MNCEDSKLFTVIVLFRGGQSVFQCIARTPKEALGKLAVSGELTIIERVGPKSLDAWLEDLEREAPVAVNETVNVWCWCAALPAGVPFVYIVGTQEM